jgi:predicted flap endonuclease-1-like 5' DNA nuclease
VIRHIQFCLEEIESEIEAQDDSGLSTAERQALREHVSSMRMLLASHAARKAAIALAAPRDDLALIRGIDPVAIDILGRAGVVSFAAMSALNTEGIKRLASAGIRPERIAEENWIEQAAILATGRLTHHARLLRRAEAIATAAGDAESRPNPVSAAPVATVTAVSGAAAAKTTQVAIGAAPADKAGAAANPTAAAASAVPAAPAQDDADVARLSRRRTFMRVAATLTVAAILGALQFAKLPAFAAIAAAVKGL